mmetsp:Transcript_70283/g.199315  ORF Transcript_70283/g.199315 Transcript_70283/m.199315 type:complete len:274 (+) Transcript_70283:974-1795(+)
MTGSSSSTLPRIGSINELKRPITTRTMSSFTQRSLMHATPKPQKRSSSSTTYIAKKTSSKTESAASVSLWSGAFTRRDCSAPYAREFATMTRPISRSNLGDTTRRRTSLRCLAHEAWSLYVGELIERIACEMYSETASSTGSSSRRDRVAEATGVLYFTQFTSLFLLVVASADSTAPSADLNDLPVGGESPLVRGRDGQACGEDAVLPAGVPRSLPQVLQPASAASCRERARRWSGPSMVRNLKPGMVWLLAPAAGSFGFAIWMVPGLLVKSW